MSLQSTSPSASLSIHRLRFLPFTPSAPTALALSPQPLGTSGRSLLAVGRQNGNIDLCVWVDGTAGSVPKGWVNHTTLVSSGSSPKKIESLAFAQTSGENYGPDRLRLFSISGGSLLTEHFLPEEFVYPGKVFSHQRKQAAKHLPGSTRTLSSQGGVIWCMAASPLSRYIALGCEDGHVRIVDIREGRFEHLALSNAAKAGVGEAATRTDRAKTRIVSLAWGPSQFNAKKQQPAKRAGSDSDSDSDSDDDDSEEWTESFILAGTTTSVALLFALNTGRLTQRLLLPKARSEQTIVWSVAVLPDSTLVTGDSLGFVTFYDAATKVPLPEGRFQVHDKGADVLCLTVGPDGRTVYSGSVDQKVSEYVFLGSKKWAHTATRRLHAHDVKAVVIDPPVATKAAAASSSARVPVLISASADLNIVLTPASPPSEVNVRTHKGGKKQQVVGASSSSPSSSSNPISSNPLTTFSSTTQRRIPYVPQSNAGSALAGSGAGTLRTCADRGWMVLRTDAAVEIWEVQSQAAQHVEGPIAGPNQNAAPYRQLLRMEMGKRRSKLISHAISADGQFLAVSDLTETKLFSLRVALGELVPKTLKRFSTVFGSEHQHAPAASAVTFTPDGRLVLATWPSESIYVVELSATAASSSSCKVIKKWSITSAISGKRAITGRGGSGNGNGNTNGKTNGREDEDDDESESESESDSDSPSSSVSPHRIDHLVASPDSQYLICASANHAWTYNLDLLSPHPRLLPSLPSRPVAIACHPSEAGIAAAALQDGSLRILQWDEGLTSRQGDQRAKWDALAAGVASKIANVRDHPSGVSWVANGSNGGNGGALLVVHGATWLLTARGAQDTDALGPAAAVAATGGKRRVRGGAGAAGDASKEAGATGADEPGAPYWTIKLTFRYQPLVHVGPIKPAGSDENGAGPSLALVERPFFELAGSLEGAWKREKRYGQ